MANVNLTERDVDYISRVVATEVPSSLRNKNPREYQRMVNAVVATITNRASTGKFGKTVQDVLNQNRAFSKIAGPERLNPYGKVENAPKASKKTQAAVEAALANLAKGVKPEIGGSLHYANPNYSDMSNLRGWINGMIAAGATKLGVGNAVHYHGTAPGVKAADPYSVSLGGKLGTKVGYQQYAESYKTEADRKKTVDSYRQYAQSQTPAPSSMMASAAPRSFDPGGILTGKAAVSLSPVSSAQASTRISAPAKSTSLAPDRQMPSGPVASRKTSTGLSYSLANTPARTKAGYSDVRAMPSGPVQAQPGISVTAKAGAGIAPAQTAYGRISTPTSLPPDRMMPSGPIGVRSYTPEMAANRLGLVGKVATPSAVASPAPMSVPVTAAAVAAPVAAPKQTIAGPLSTPTIQAPAKAAPAPAKEKGILGKAIDKITSPENVASAGLAAVGSTVAGPIGGILGGIIGKELGKNGLAGLNTNSGPMSINNIGGGLAAVSQAMGGPRGMQANYTSPAGGGTITSLGNGNYQRTSNKYGWSEVTDAAGNTYASGGGGGGLLSGLFGGGKSKSEGKKK